MLLVTKRKNVAYLEARLRFIKIEKSFGMSSLTAYKNNIMRLPCFMFTALLHSANTVGVKVLFGIDLKISLSELMQMLCSPQPLKVGRIDFLSKL